MKQISIALQTDKTPAEYAALAQLIDRYGFDVVSVYCDAPFHPSYAALLLMAPHLHHARIGAAAIPPARIHPIDIAAQTALLAQMARGRRLRRAGARGVAGGSRHRGSEKPIQAMREAAAVVRYLLEGKTGGYRGRNLSAGGARPRAVSAADQPIPLLIGTWGRRLGALAGEIADEVKIGGSANPDLIPVMRGYIARANSAQGAQGAVGIGLGAVTVIDEDREQARAAARQAVALYLPVVAPLDPTVTVEPELIARLQTAVEQAITSRRTADLRRPAGSLRLRGQRRRHHPAGGSALRGGAAGSSSGRRTACRRRAGIRLLGEKMIPALKGN